MQRSASSPRDPRDDYPPRLLYQPHAVSSTLDIDQSRLSFPSSYQDEDDELSASDDDLDTSSSRISLGPKMRIHSPAPWEVDEGGPQEEEQEYHSFPPPKKTFPFSFTKSSDTGRPSLESNRSQEKPKRSFDTTHSQLSYPRGALYALAQESLSASSVVSSTGQQGLRGKNSSNRLRSDSTSQNHASPGAPSTAIRFTDSSPRHDQDSSNHPQTRRRPTYDATTFHPYANPDLISSSSSDQSHSHAPGKVAPPIKTAIDPVASSSQLTPDSKLPAAIISTPPSPLRTSSVPANGKDAPSLGVAFNNIVRVDSLDAGQRRPSGVSGSLSIQADTIWSRQNVVTPFALISLEEARAQRSRSATIHVTEPVLPSQSLSVPGANEPESRARSISAGAKAKNAIQSIVGANSGQPKLEKQISMGNISAADATSGKALKHKKSGFLRLFNGRTTEREDKAPTPPLPSTPIECVTPLKVQKMIHRIPVPEMTPSLLDEAFRDEPSSYVPEASPSDHPQSPKRPPLSIDVQPPRFRASRVPTSPTSDAFHRPRVVSSRPPEEKSPLPQSAPANLPDFPALRLRPVSTIFSAQFTEHIIPRDSLSSSDTNVDTPASASLNKMFLPSVPSSATRSEFFSSDDHTTAQSSENHTTLINSLQEQVLSERSENLAQQQYRSELEGRLKELEAELAELRSVQKLNGFCTACGRGQPSVDTTGNCYLQPHNHSAEVRVSSVLHRPRARTATSSRFGSAVP